MEFSRFITEKEPALRELLRALCAIPAPSHHEDARAEFCLDYFRALGVTDAYIDGAKNVVCPIGDSGGSLRVFMAHTDTVFPDTEPMPMIERDGRLCCPGVGDDTANLAVMMMVTEYIVKHAPDRARNLLVVANSCEEGLGNLKGTREIVKNYGDRIGELVSFDGGLSIVNRAVGSERWKVTVSTVGGHSYGDFGNENAIARLSKLVSELYCQTVPEIDGAKTTYNVGEISGGTSVNTIAQHAEMLYEYRSDSNTALAEMRDRFESIVERNRDSRAEISLELLGVRPGMVESRDPARLAELTDRAAAALARVIGREPERRPGSTDCNIPFSLGIPTVCLGLIDCGGAHTREEYVLLDSLADGMRICGELMLGGAC